ncbi:MAG: hypothetical protein ACLGGU_03105, partial [Gammaproteobacteria bacterium]
AAFALGAASGLVIALAGETSLFAPWRAGLAEAHFGGAPIPAPESTPPTSDKAACFVLFSDKQRGEPCRDDDRRRQTQHHKGEVHDLSLSKQIAVQGLGPI